MKKFWVIVLVCICVSSVYSQENSQKITDIARIQDCIPESTESSMSGKEVVVKGIITVPPGVFRDEIIYVQDKTGGIEVYCRNLPECKLGDEVRVTGEVMEYNNETEIGYSKVEIAESDKKLPDPKPIKAEDVDKEEFEGLLVTVSGKVIKTPDGSKNKWFKIEDDSGTAEIYVYDKSGIDLLEVSLGKDLNITGVASQYKNSRQIRLRFQSDLKEIKEEPEETKKEEKKE